MLNIINVNAYRGDFSNIKFTGTCSYGGGGVAEWTFSANNSTDVVFISSANVVNNVTSVDGWYIFTNKNSNTSFTFNRGVVINNGVGWYSDEFVFISGIDPVSVLGYDNSYGVFFIRNENSIFIDGSSYSIVMNSDQDLEYVYNSNDVKKYFEGDDSVLNLGDPDNNTIEDNSLPVPQALTCDLKNNDEGAPRFIAGSWKNPEALLSSFDASSINIEIQYKPKLQFYKKLFDLKLGIGQSSKWLDVYSGSIQNVKSWVSYMNLSENNPTSSGTQFCKNGKSDISLIASLNNIENYSSHVELMNGSSWRCRYVVNGKSSLWVVYGVDSINALGRPTNSGDNISFENASGDSVSSSDVNYDNSSMTSPNYEDLSFIGKLSYNINQLFENLKSFFSPQDSNNGFYVFFAKVFEQFPIFWALFILGL